MRLSRKWEFSRKVLSLASSRILPGDERERERESAVLFPSRVMPGRSEMRRTTPVHAIQACSNESLSARERRRDAEIAAERFLAAV
jgi:hypothetical protein